VLSRNHHISFETMLQTITVNSRVYYLPGLPLSSTLLLLFLGVEMGLARECEKLKAGADLFGRKGHGNRNG
jgi:hypothetical protein